MADAACAKDLLGPELAGRIEALTLAALRRKPADEAAIAGALRVLCEYSPRLADLLLGTVDSLIRRGSLGRPLYRSLVRGLGALDYPGGAEVLTRALVSDDAGGLATLSACCMHRAAALAEPLARIAVSRHPHLAFAAQLAQLSRGESDGRGIAGIAPKIKEVHRIELCSEVLMPLLWHAPLPPSACPALAVLRDSERHLGRWLVLGELGRLAGDPAPLAEARERATDGAQSARSAWALVAWVLGPGDEPPPDVRPTLELVARLSDRPSAERDTTFLFRLAAHRALSARSLLEHFARPSSLASDVAVRSALYLARDHGRADLLRALGDLARSSRSEPLRGLALAALFDAGAEREAYALLQGPLASRQPKSIAWAALVRAHAEGLMQGLVVNEARFRRLQLGWAE